MSNENTNTTPEAASSALLPVVRIPLADIVPDPKNRKGHDPVKIAELAETLRVDGQLQPIVVRRLAPRDDVKPFQDGAWGHCVVEGVVGHLEPLFTQLPDANVARVYAAVYRRGGYMIVAGERRWTAAGVLAWSEIEARVQDDAKTSLQSVRARVAENMHREGLSCIEEAENCRDLAAEGMTQPEIAAFIGKKSASTVSNALRLLKLPPVVQGLLKEGLLDRAYGVSLCRFVAWPRVVEVMARQIVNDEHMTQKQFEKEKLPYNRELVRMGLVASLDTGPYVMPANDPDYLQTYAWRAHCFNPAKWVEEKARQDAARVAREQAAAARDAKKGKASGLSAKELAERRKVVEANKAKKAKTAAEYVRFVQALRDGEVDSNVLAAIVVEQALRGTFGAGRIGEAFDRLGINKPRGFRTEHTYGIEGKELLTYKTENVLAVATAAIIGREVEYALKDAREVPYWVTRALQCPKVKAPKGVTDPKILAEWAKADAKGMPVEEIARSYNADLADVCGALGKPVPAKTKAAAAAAAGKDLPLFASPAAGKSPVDKVVVVGGNRAGKAAAWPTPAEVKAEQAKVRAKVAGAKSFSAVAALRQVVKSKPVPRGKAGPKKEFKAVAALKSGKGAK
jgi:ParB-like chromosome segregation protein Spo0J